MSEITRDNAIPPSGPARYTRNIRNVLEFPVHIFKECHRHPFPNYDEIRRSVAVEIRKQGIADHADILQFRRYVRGDIREFYMTILRVIAENKTADRLRIPARQDASGHEQIQFAVPVVVEGPYA